MTAGGLILSVNKPVGWTSFDVVAKLRRAFGWKSVGHAGTLDPTADGVLILLCGSATKRTEEFMELPKEYAARVRFGVTTTTDDLAGTVLTTSSITEWDINRIGDALGSFVGEIEQVPPKISALKIGGRRSYDLAREGRLPDLAPRRVCVHELRLVGAKCPEIDLAVRCSRGTYVRALARDLGAVLGWGAALAALTRTAVGPYRTENALTMSEIERRVCEFGCKAP